MSLLQKVSSALSRRCSGRSRRRRVGLRGFRGFRRSCRCRSRRSRSRRWCRRLRSGRSRRRSRFSRSSRSARRSRRFRSRRGRRWSRRRCFLFFELDPAQAFGRRALFPQNRGKLRVGKSLFGFDLVFNLGAFRRQTAARVGGKNKASNIVGHVFYSPLGSETPPVLRGEEFNGSMSGCLVCIGD